MADNKKKIAVQRGDTLTGLSQKYGGTVNDWTQLNGIANPNLIYTGQQLFFPAGSGAVKGDAVKVEAPVVAVTQPNSAGFTPSASLQNKENVKNNDVNAWKNFNIFGMDDWEHKDAYNAMWSEYLNRPDFQYDLNGDVLYQQYKDKYIQQGKMAMADTMGQASAMTGGYGNSYAVTAGNQAYQASLENLNDIVPQLYQMAYDKYNQEGQDMLTKLGLYKDDYNTRVSESEFEYGRLGDIASHSNSDYWNSHTAESGEYWNKWNADYQTEQAKKTDENRKQDQARDVAIEMIRGGLTPSKEVLDAAGISEEDAKAMAGAYASQGSTSGNGSTPSGVHMSWDQYESFLEQTDRYIMDNDMPALKSYLDGLITNNLIDWQFAVDFWIKKGGAKEELEGQIGTDVPPKS